MATAGPPVIADPISGCLAGCPPVCLSAHLPFFLFAFLQGSRYTDVRSLLRSGRGSAALGLNRRSRYMQTGAELGRQCSQPLQPEARKGLVINE